MAKKWEDLLRMLEQAEFWSSVGENDEPRVRVEVGRYKPFAMPTIKKAEREGYRVERLIRGGVYLIYPKAKPAGLAKVFDRVFTVVAKFKTDDEANAYMLANPDTGLLAIQDGWRLIAKLADKGQPAYLGNSMKARHAYAIGVEGAAGPFQIKVGANDRGQATRIAERAGYQVRDANMIG